MHAARLTSPRLVRTLAALRGAEGEISTWELGRAARVCAVNSVVAGLRAHGFEIRCRQEVQGGQRRFYYTLLKESGADGG